MILLHSSDGYSNNLDGSMDSIFSLPHLVVRLLNSTDDIVVIRAMASNSERYLLWIFLSLQFWMVALLGVLCCRDRFWCLHERSPVHNNSSGGSAGGSNTVLRYRHHIQPKNTRVMDEDSPLEPSIILNEQSELIQMTEPEKSNMSFQDHNDPDGDERCTAHHNTPATGTDHHEGGTIRLSHPWSIAEMKKHDSILLRHHQQQNSNASLNLGTPSRRSSFFREEAARSRVGQKNQAALLESSGSTSGSHQVRPSDLPLGTAVIGRDSVLVNHSNRK